MSVGTHVTHPRAEPMKPPAPRERSEAPPPRTETVTLVQQPLVTGNDVTDIKR